MGNPVPTLDTNGWLRDSLSKVVAIFNNYLSTSYSQSDVYRGSLRSLPFTIASNPKDIRALRSDIIDDLTTMYGAYTDGVTVNVSIGDYDGSKELPYYDITIDVKVQEGLETFSIGRFIKVVNGQIKSVSDL